MTHPKIMKSIRGNAIGLDHAGNLVGKAPTGRDVGILARSPFETLAIGSKGVGSVPTAVDRSTVWAHEEYAGGWHRTVLELVNLPVSVTSVTTGNGVGGTKLYTCPEGRIAIGPTFAELAISIATANQADFTDATPEGDIGIGSLAPANADALGTDATDDDISTATAFTMAAYADSSVICPPDDEGIYIYDGTTTALPVFANVLVDAADIDDDTTSAVLLNGFIDFNWRFCGD